MPLTLTRPRRLGHPLPGRERGFFTSALLITCIVFLTACNGTSEVPPARTTPFPQVRNIRPDLPYVPAKAILHSRHAYLPLNADLAEAWEAVGHEGLEADLIDRWKANGVKIGTVSMAGASRFMEKLPGNFGVVQQSQAVSNDPVILETTPRTSRKFELAYAPTAASSETLSMPLGQSRLIVDFQITPQGATLRLVPQHHWYEVTLGARTPQEKLLDGRLFAEMAMLAKLSPEQVLVLAYEQPPQPKKPEKEPEPAPPAGPVDGVTSQPPVVTDAPPAPPDAAIEAIRGPEKPPLPTLGTMMFTGERAGRPLQVVVMLYVPQQGESKPPVPEIRPEGQRVEGEGPRE